MRNKCMRIAVLAGGISAERDVSLLSGELVCSALRSAGHETALVDSFLGVQIAEEDIPSLFTTVRTEERHSIPRELPDLDEVRARRSGEGEIGPNVIEILRYADITYNALHGGDGENGRMQAFLDMMSIPYTGDGYLPSALAMHKDIAKMLFEKAGVPVPPGRLVKRGNERESTDWHEGYPCIVKPAASGSSVGVVKVETAAQLEHALITAFRHGSEVLVERFIDGREFSVGVLGGKALPVIEMLPSGGAYDYAHKYQSGLTQETCPARIPEETALRMQDLAQRACACLGIEILARGEFILTPDGEIYCLEMNTLPGMTPISLLPQEAAAIGIDYTQLCLQIVELSQKKYGK